MDTADTFFKAVGLDRPEFGQGSIFFSTMVCALKWKEGCFLIKPVFEHEISTRILESKLAKPANLLLNLDPIGSLLERWWDFFGWFFGFFKILCNVFSSAAAKLITFTLSGRVHQPHCSVFQLVG